MSTAFLFPGQGSQHVGMGLDLVQVEPASRAVFDRADELLGFSLSTLCFEGPEKTLRDTANQQPALLVNSIAMLRAMEVRDGPSADFVAGHSLGEFSALIAAGSLSFDDGLNLVKNRGRLMKKAGEEQPGAMAAILGLDVSTAQEICELSEYQTGRPVQIANDNCPGQVVISGDIDALNVAVQLAESEGARKVIKLPISIAAHSPLMNTAANNFSSVLENTVIKAPNKPIIGNVSAAPLTNPDEIRDELMLQLTSPVNWTDSMKFLLDQGVDTYYEVGSGSVLLGLMKRIDRKANRKKWEISA